MARGRRSSGRGTLRDPFEEGSRQRGSAVRLHLDAARPIGDEDALAPHGRHQAGPGKATNGLEDREPVDAQLVGERPDARELLPRTQRAVLHGIADASANLDVERSRGIRANSEFPGHGGDYDTKSVAACQNMVKNHVFHRPVRAES